MFFHFRAIANERWYWTLLFKYITVAPRPQFFSFLILGTQNPTLSSFFVASLFYTLLRFFWYESDLLPIIHSAYCCIYSLLRTSR